MKLTDKNIDQLFRDAAQNEKAPGYSSSYWNEMNSMLNERDKSRRIYAYRVAAGTLLFAFLVGILFMINNGYDMPNKNLKIAGAEDSVKSLAAKSGNSADRINQKSNNIPVEAEKNFTEFENEHISERRLSFDRKSGLKTENKELAGSSEKEYAQFSNRKSIAPSKTENLNTQVIMPEKKERILNSEINPSSGSDLKSSDNLLTSEQKKEISDLNISEVTDFSLQPLLLNFNTLDTEGLVDFKEVVKEKNLLLYAKFSAGLMENYETSRPFQSGLFDLSASVEWKKNQLSLRSGLGFQMSTNADLVVSQRAKVYGFGVTNYQTNLSYQTLYDLYIPAEFGYIHGTTSFGVGAQINYLLGTKMNYETYENKELTQTSTYNGHKEGLNPFTTQGYVWAEEKITPRISAGIKIGTHLSSRIKEGKYFNESSTTNPLFGQLSLRYNF
ncbi:MAG: hypothetical protein R3277_07640 [Brumimicrobium sp.]|nr:hypothetical protein [Brumimicrobium sp.]